MTPPLIILASSSPRRRDLLRLIGVPHEVHPAEIDERPDPCEEPAAHAERLAREKAMAVAAEHPDAIVIGSDTIVVVDDRILGKPRDEADAKQMLRQLSGRSHTVFTAVAAVRAGTVEADVEAVDVTFRALSDHEIARYVATGEPMDKAGAYGIQGYGATIVERIEGDYFAVMGLAIVRLLRLLGRHGVRYDFGRVIDAGTR